MDSYLTIKTSAEGIYKEKGSKFIAKAFPISSEEEVKEIISKIKKEYYDARHHCYAYRIGAEGERFRCVDDGEPSSTAGKPIYGQLLSKNLTNMLIVVIRYFGGTKLGVPGLIKAYKEASIDVINSSDIIEKTVDAYYSISFEYEQMNNVMKIIKDITPNVIKQDFGNMCLMELSIRKDDEKIMTDRFKKIDSLSIDFKYYL